MEEPDTSSPTILSSQMGHGSHCAVLSAGTTANISSGHFSLSGKWHEQSGINEIALVFNLQITDFKFVNSQFYPVF